MFSIIALVGLPGSGKSTVGKQLAKLLHCKVIDSDALIEEYVGCSIAQYFEREGQDAFRDLEAQALQEIVQMQESMVLATGGGIILRAANRALLKERCFVVYLHADAAQLYVRLKNDRTRPLLQNTDILAKLEQLYSERHSLYAEAAHLQVESTLQSAQVLAEQIAASLQSSL